MTALNIISHEQVTLLSIGHLLFCSTFILQKTSLTWHHRTEKTIPMEMGMKGAKLKKVMVI